MTFTSALLAVVIPTAQAQIPIRDLQRDPGVSVSGEIRSVVGNEFILEDGTGQIIVDAGPRWYHQLNLRQGEKVTVVGEYDDYDFDAFSITRSNGEVIRIRNAGGPPPWAGGRGRGDRK
ncbi:MAG: DNA-binding protein [Desmonostoc geniculatum HA4340-LM1]|nr:DNA-binding protein [Desmonostoc geniculatum HA4340-LM1]